MAVVVGFIPTEVGYAALSVARAEAERRGGPLVLVNVIRDGVQDDPRHADSAALEAALETLRHAAVRVQVRQEHTQDDIADVLLRVVDEEKAELLVIANRREESLGRHLLGLTIQKLVLSANSAVLIV